MKRKKSFSNQLTAYFAIILCIVFILISVTIGNTIRRFIGNNASLHSQSIAANIRNLLDKRLESIENLPENAVLQLLKEYKALHSEYFFITDAKGNYICHPDNHTAARKNILRLSVHVDTAFSRIARKIVQGETGCSLFFRNKEKYFIHYAPLPSLDWRLGVCCPYKEVCSASGELYLFCFLGLGTGMMLLFGGANKLIRRLASPFGQIAASARQIASGDFHASLPEQETCKEASELCTSLRHLQQNLASNSERLKASIAEKEQRNNEIKLAARLQRHLLPIHRHLSPCLSVKAEIWQKNEIGGDLYEYFMSGDLLYFAIGDVTGKGIPAALHMASFCQLFRYIAQNYQSTATICNILNRQMYGCPEQNICITAFIGILDTRNGQLKYTNAGHHSPLLICTGETPNHALPGSEHPIGLLPTHHFGEETHSLLPGSSLLLYTDGCMDAENPAGQFYTRERMFRNIEEAPDKTPACLVPYLLASIREFTGSRGLSDDLTIMQIHYQSPTGHA